MVSREILVLRDQPDQLETQDLLDHRVREDHKECLDPKELKASRD